MLSDIKARSARPKDKPYKLTDGQGLFLFVTPVGGKIWRFKYRFGGVEKLLSFGAYPSVSLAEAREKRDAARKQLSNDINPGDVRKALKNAVTAGSTVNSFEAIAREWHVKFKKKWTATHAETTIERLERDVFPWIGARPVGEINAPELLTVLRRIEERGAVETAHRVRSICGKVFRYAIATGRRVERDPSVDLKDAIPPASKENLAALTDPKDVGPLLRAIDSYNGSFVVKCAMQLAAMFFVRPGELRHAEWSEFDLENGLWSIPAGKMKMKQPHIVPLSRQAIEILKSLQPLTGRSQYVFPSPRTNRRPMSNNAVLAALRRMGYSKDEMTGHGFRAMARTIMDEVLEVRSDFIEHQLAHMVKDPNGTAYNRTKHLKERKKMMQKWSDYLDGLKAGAKILPFAKKAG